MWNIFLEFFTNPFNILIGVIFLCAGILWGLVLFRYIVPSKNQILYCRERDGRGIELNVAEEDAISLETNSKPEFRFFKWGRSYEFLGRLGRSFTRFFGKEGTAYTWRLEGFTRTPTKFKKLKEMIEVQGEDGKFRAQQVVRNVPIAWKEKQLELEFPTLEDAVRFRWGNTFYDEVPEEMQQKLREDKVFLTVNLEPGIVPEGYEPISEATIRKKANEDMSELIATGVKGAIKKNFMIDILPWVLAGAGAIMVIGKFFGWF